MNIENLTYNIMLDEILDHNDPVFRHLYEVYNLYNKNHTIKPYEIIEKNFLSYIFVGNLLYKLDKKIMLHDVYVLESTKYDFYIKFLSVNSTKVCGKIDDIDSFLKKIKILRDDGKIFEQRLHQSIKILDKIKKI